MSTGAGVIRLEREDDVALIVLNRPKARNAVDLELAIAICAAMTDAQDARAIVLTGADPAFCAGLDLRTLGTERIADVPQFIQAVADSAVPVVAAVNGPAVTGGFELALACDFVVASERASFADTHLLVGVYPGSVLVDLPRRVGMAWAREMSLTGNFVDAETALRIGITNHVVPHDDLLPYARQLAHAIAEHDHAMVSTMRRDWDATASLPIDEARRVHRRLGVEAGFTGVAGSEIAARREAVLARSRVQRRPRPG